MDNIVIYNAFFKELQHKMDGSAEIAIDLSNSRYIS